MSLLTLWAHIALQIAIANTLNDTVAPNKAHDMQLPTTCPEYEKCRNHIGVEFSCVSLTPLKLFTGDPVHWAKIPDVIPSHLLIKQGGLPNFLG